MSLLDPPAPFGVPTAAAGPTLCGLEADGPAIRPGVPPGSWAGSSGGGGFAGFAPAGGDAGGGDGGPGERLRELAARMTALRRLYELIRRVNVAPDLASVLQAVVDGVVDGLGFGVAVVNLVHVDGSFETVAVAGSQDARADLLGVRRPAGSFDREFAVAERWGGLRFVPHERLTPEEITGWVPPPGNGPAVDAPDAWHPLDALFAPLTGPSGDLVGMLSVDLPEDGRRPGDLRRELLEMFASQAGIAVDNARLAERLRASEASFRLAFDGAATGMSMISLDPRAPGRFLRVNAAMCAITGFTADQLTRMTFADITHPDDLGDDLDALAQATLGRRDAYRAEKRYRRPDGTVVWVAITTSVIQLESGENLYAISQVEDITARRAADAELARRASQDPLTGLLNRAGLREHLDAALHRTRRGDAAGVVLFCDLDGFKAVNDTHGHDVGDQVLTIVAGRLGEQVRDRDVVARLGGDEFVVHAAGLSVPEAEVLALRVEQSLATPIRVGGVTVAVTVSIGIAALTAATATVDELLRAADSAMYAAKAAGRNRHTVHPLPDHDPTRPT